MLNIMWIGYELVSLNQKTSGIEHIYKNGRLQKRLILFEDMSKGLRLLITSDRKQPFGVKYDSWYSTTRSGFTLVNNVGVQDIFCYNFR